MKKRDKEGAEEKPKSKLFNCLFTKFSIIVFIVELCGAFRLVDDDEL
jgi:hypothetical protein